jgi:tetratricopeptide (TPR) repeat protein
MREPRNAGARVSTGKLLLVVLAILAATVGWRLRQHAPSPDGLLSQARQALEAKQYAAVGELCERILAARPQQAEALLFAGEAAAKQGRLHDALKYYERVGAGDNAAGARNAAGAIWQQIGHASNAEAKYREALELEPGSAFAHEHLAFLLTAQNRRFESLPHIYELLRQGRASYDFLLFVGDHSATVDMSEAMARFRAAAPDDPAPLIGMARLELYRKNYAEAARLSRQVLAAATTYIEAHALLGRALLQEGRDDELTGWSAALPADADAHPDVWLVRGLWARHCGQPQWAARCMWESLRRDPNHQGATLQLSQLLGALGESATAESLAERAAALSEFSSTISSLFGNRDSPEMLFRAARQAETLGRLWEARGWNRTAISVLGDVRWAQEALARIEPYLNDSSPPTLPEFDPGIQFDLSHYPLPSELRSTRAVAAAPAAPSSAQPRFEDVAQQAGIAFSYFCGREGTEPRPRMFQFTGGGVAVIDYDLDGWPDLYFTQGCRWPPPAGQTEFLDEIYRNLGNGQFEKVTQQSQLGDDRFSQGATVGDFNNDGFPDLYVANIGINRLYMNNGDGTFTDVSASTGISADRWTTSCLLADLSGDGLPDLYDVNYLEGPDVFERICYANDVPRSCQPRAFTPPTTS